MKVKATGKWTEFLNWLNGAAGLAHKNLTRLELWATEDDGTPVKYVFDARLDADKTKEWKEAA